MCDYSSVLPAQSIMKIREDYKYAITSQDIQLVHVNMCQVQARVSINGTDTLSVKVYIENTITITVKCSG